MSNPQPCINHELNNDETIIKFEFLLSNKIKKSDLGTFVMNTHNADRLILIFTAGTLELCVEYSA